MPAGPSHDPRGNPCGTRNAAALAAAETALWRMMSFYDVPTADLDAATAHDPGWALPHLMRAGFVLSLTEPALLNEAASHLQRARALADGAPARERAHLEAVQAVLDGRWQLACAIWDGLLIDHPRDALALQWAQLWDFYRGDSAQLRLRPARALPEWDESDPLYPYVLSLYAFGLEECNLYPQAEEAGRRALSLNPKVPWAVHAVAHVMEMRGRCEEGAAWLRQYQEHWCEGNGFCGHLWWHTGLFRLEALDLEGVLRLADNHLAADRLQITLQRIDAAALLWRLRLLGCAAARRLGSVATGRRLLRLQRPARGAGAARRRAVRARRKLGCALRRARAGRRGRAAQQPRDGARGRTAVDARAAGFRTRRVRCRRRRAVPRARAGAAFWRQPCAARPDRPDAARGRGAGLASGSGPRVDQRAAHEQADDAAEPALAGAAAPAGRCHRLKCWRC
jgi:hypothetical protein